MYVKQLAKLMNVTADTVRHYTRVGLLNPVRSAENSYQEYTKQDQQRLKFIISARQLGFSLKDIQQIVDESEQGNCPCPLTRKLIAKRLEETEVLFQETLKLRNRMHAAITQWETSVDGANASDVCSLIESFVDPINDSVNKEQRNDD
ncbi:MULTISPECIES: MerR family transcriptional regulator [unclassified Pseudoalteromonas]|jgi:DNA-binding transcriptional MerR regulator|uniref:MerR family transcriptional regulator n=1 Tax=unclassified Pseudoalteromonas TaxID=194690 RepID=UPI00110BD332|nr:MULTISPECIES: MerR family transcriptional regulator [unclassified Pseudoalteromonas]TMO06857.1 MerR family transcriptional regulator [Pseudoalteromonas sp. S558]